jgi:hypothetical protein
MKPEIRSKKDRVAVKRSVMLVSWPLPYFLASASGEWLL